MSSSQQPGPLVTGMPVKLPEAVQLHEFTVAVEECYVHRAGQRSVRRPLPRHRTWTTPVARNGHRRHTAPVKVGEERIYNSWLRQIRGGCIPCTWRYKRPHPISQYRRGHWLDDLTLRGEGLWTIMIQWHTGGRVRQEGVENPPVGGITAGGCSLSVSSSIKWFIDVDHRKIPPR